MSKVDEDACTACGTCFERCKFNAIVVEDFARIDEDKCVGCGLCVITCPEEAMKMEQFERGELTLDS